MTSLPERARPVAGAESHALESHAHESRAHESRAHESHLHESRPHESQTYAGLHDPELITDVLARIVAELEAVAGRIDESQAEIARAARPRDPDQHDPDNRDPANHDQHDRDTRDQAAAYAAAVQDADFSAQRIAGVATFLKALAEASPPSWKLDTTKATGTLKIHHLVNTIGNRKAQQAQQNHTPGELDLF